MLSLGLVFLHRRCLVAAVRAEALGTLLLLVPGADSGAGTSLLLLHGLAAVREYEIAVHRAGPAERRRGDLARSGEDYI